MSSPLQSKWIEHQHKGGLQIGMAAMQGYRYAMEDRHHIQMSLSQQHPNISFVGVYDGHSGEKAAEFLAQHWHQRLGELKSPWDQPAKMPSPWYCI